MSLVASRTPSTPKQRFVLHVTEARRGLVTRELHVPPREIVFVKSIVEASEGLCSVFGERDAPLVLAAPPGREAELDELVADLLAEIPSARLAIPPADVDADDEVRRG